MASASPKATRTTVTPQRGRGRGRPRLYARGTSSALSSRSRTPSSVSKVLETPTNRRRAQQNVGYRPGGPGGGGRFVDPDTGAEVPGGTYRDMQKKRTPRSEGSGTARRSAPQPPPPPPPPPPSSIGPDGVYKPREERSYKEFHHGFEISQKLCVLSAEEVDGENYKLPMLENKTVKIVEIMEEGEMRNYEAKLRLEEAIVDKDRRLIKLNTASSTSLLFQPEDKSYGSPGALDVPMVDVQSTDDFPLDPALTKLTPPLPITDTFPIDPALSEDSQPIQAQTHTPAATPTDGPMKEEVMQSEKSPPSATSASTVSGGLAKKGKDVPTLASLRPHRSNAGKPPPRPVPPPTSRRSRNQNQNSRADEKLDLRAPSYRKIEPFRYSDFAWNNEIGSIGAYGLNNPSLSKAQFPESMIKLGYQSSSTFNKPQTLYRDYPDPGIDEELGSAHHDVVEYDMDEQDDKWLVTYNSHRVIESSTISRELFEIALSKIEKEWVNLERKILKVQAKPHGTGMSSRRRSAGRPGEEDDDEGAEDSKCAICDDGECENANAIVFCDGCNLAVHQECYGVPYIPEGQWHCRKCQQLPRQTANCVFCPNTDGAFKQTTTNRWAHLLCAIWIPEVRLANPAFMEPVEGMESVPKSRWKLSCYICKQKMGACIQCSNKSCFIAFHVTCGRRGRLHMKMKNSSGPGAQLESSGLKAYCDRHVPADWRRENDVDTAIVDAMDFYAKELSGREWDDSQASAIVDPNGRQEDGFLHRGYPRSVEKRRREIEQPKAIWKLPSGAPVIPQILYTKVADYMSRFDIKDVKGFTAEACKYWSLKREARRGACLIRRLQIQTDSNSFTSLEVARKNYSVLGHTQGGKKLQGRKEFAKMIEQDLAGLMEIMTGQNWTTQDALSKEADMLRNYVDAVYFPELPLMRKLLHQVQLLDINKNFQLGFALVSDRIEHRLYPGVSAFATDIQSVLKSSPYDPHLAFDIRVQGYIPPAFVSCKGSPENHRSSLVDRDRQRMIRFFEELLPQSVAIEKELLGQMYERPPKRVRRLHEMEYVNGRVSNPLDDPKAKRPYSPSTQLAKELSAGNKSPTSTVFTRNTFLGALAPTLSNSMAHGQWKKPIPQWFVNNYRFQAPIKEGIMSVSDYDDTINNIGAKFEKLSEFSPEIMSPVPSPVLLPTLTANSAGYSASVALQQDVSLQTKIQKPTHPKGDVGFGVDDDMEDAPGDIDEEFLPPVFCRLSEPPIEQVPDRQLPSHIHSDLHDEDAEGEIDEEMPLAPTLDIGAEAKPLSTYVPPTATPPPELPAPIITSTTQTSVHIQVPTDHLADRPVNTTVVPDSALQNVPLLQPRVCLKSQEERPWVTEMDAVINEEIKNDDLLGGYRAEDLPSPLGTVADIISSPTTPKAPTTVLQVAMASNPPPPSQQVELESLDLPGLSQNNGFSERQENLEVMTNTSVLSDYPDELDGEYEMHIVQNNPKIKGMTDNRENENSGASADDLTPSPSSSEKRSTPKKAGDFKREANGRFGKTGCAPRSPTRSRRRKKV